MEKLMQAVNVLRGDLGNSLLFHSERDSEVYFSEKQKHFICTPKELKIACRYICTVEEFNNLVAELSAAEWIK
jgi:hypothetical protein